MPTGFIPPIPQRVLEQSAATGGDAQAVKLNLPEQKSEVDANLAFEVQRLAFEQVEEIGEKIRARIAALPASATGSTVQIVYLDRMLRGGLDLLGATSSQLINLTLAFGNAGMVAQEGLDQFHAARGAAMVLAVRDFAVAQAVSPSPAPFALTGAQSALNLLGLLATESHYYGRSVKIEEEPFLLEFSSRLRKLGNVIIYHPALFTPWSKKTSFAIPAAVSTDFDAVLAARNVASRPVKRLLAEASALKPDDPLYPEMRFAADQAREQFESADSLLRELNARLSEKDEAVGATGLQMLVRAAAMVEIFEKSDTTTYLLLARMEVAGGAYRTVRSLARTVFGGDGVDYSAGLIASFGLFDLEGKLLDSGILTTRKSFQAVVPVKLWQDILAPLAILVVFTILLGFVLRR